MRQFRHRMRRSRVFILVNLFVVAFYAIEGTHYTQAYAALRQESQRLEEISDRLGIPVERLRRDNPSLVETLENLVSDPEDRFRARQLERLEAVLERSQAEVEANPFRDRIEAVKLEHRKEKLEGVLRDLAEVSSPRVLRLRPAARKALLRNLESALREELLLPPLPEGLPGKAVARHREMEDRLRSLARDVEPLLSAPDALSDARLSRTVADLVGAVNGAVGRPDQPAPRFRERPLPVQRVEREAPTAPAPGPASRSATPAATSSPAVAAPGRPLSFDSLAAGAAPPAGAIATEITALAASLGDSPARIFAWVHDNVAYDPKWGQVRSPLGTLLERTGTSWDQASLLAELLTAAGVDARLEWGEVEIPEALLLELTGTANATDAGGVLATGGVPILLQQIASQVVTAKLSHVWVKAHVDYIPNRGVTPGPPDTWIRMDPSLKRSSYQPGIAVHQSVPYTLGDYLQSATPLSPRRFRSESLWAYIRANNIECTTLDQLKKAGSILEESFSYIPGTLRGKIVSVGGEDPAVPAAFRHRLRVEVKSADGASLLAWEEPWAELWGARSEIVWVGATAADEATIASFGSVFDTPPYLVDLVPTVRLDGVEVARGSAIGSARGTEVWVTLLEASGEATTLTHDTLAGEHHVLAVDFGRLPQRLIDDHQAALAAAIAAGDDFEAEAETLFLLGAQYMSNLGRDLDDLAGWNWQRLVKLGTEGLISQTGIVTTTVGGTPIGFRRGERNVDVARMILGIFPADGDHQYKTATFELLGSQSSYLEGEVFNQVLAREGIASVSALTRSNREGQALTRVDGGNVGMVLAQVDLGAEAEDAVAFAVSQGKIAWVAETPITVNQWTGTGYVLEDPATGAAGYLISGGLAGGADTGENLAELQNTLGSEAWLEGSPLGDLLDRVLDFYYGLGADPGGNEPESNQGDPINLSNGNFWITETDLIIQARGLPISWQRTYNSRSTYNGPLGYGWTFSYGEHLEPQPDGSVLYREADGTEHRFASDGLGGYERPAGKHLELTETPSGFTLRAKDGLLTEFDPGGKLVSTSDANGNTVLLGYNPAEELETVTDAGGRTVLIVTHAAGKISQVTDLAGRSIGFSYTGDDLTAVTDTFGELWTFAYDAAHNLVARTDPLSHSNTYSYDSLDRCVGHTDPLGNTETFAYSSIGSSAVLTDRRGFDTFLEFDETGRAVLAVDPLGNAMSSTWDSDNNRTSTTDSRGGLTTRTFDGNGNLLSETNPLNETTSFTYDPTHNRVLTVIDPANHQVTNTYDAGGNLIERSQVVGGETLTETFDYDSFGQLIETRDARDNPSTFGWDATKGTVESQTDALSQTTVLTTDSLGRVVNLRDPDLNDYQFDWDAGDRLVSTTDPSSNSTTIDYDELGRQVLVTSPASTRTFEYDAGGRLLSTSDAAGNTTRLEYDDAGNRTATITPLGNRSTSAYDALGRLVAMVDPLGGAWTAEYCAEIGRDEASFCALTDPQGNTTRQEHDELGRVIGMTDPLGNTHAVSYDNRGRRDAVTDPLLNSTSFEYDDLGRLTAVVEANTARTEYSYDKNGNLVRVRDAENRDWLRTYDALNRLKTDSDPLGNTTTLTYDPLGNLESRLTPNGDLITFDWDVRKLAAVNLPGGVQETFTYDSQGRRESMTNNEASLSYAYDPLGRLASVTNHTLGQTLAYSYDEEGNLTEMVGPNGTVEYFYNAKNLLVELRDPVSGRFSFSYDERDNRTQLLYPNGVATEYSYDAAGRLLSLITRDGGQQVVDGYSYTYDAAGRRSSQTALRDQAVHSYQYDEVNRLTRWERGAGRFEEYLYDLVGNRQSLADQLGATTYDYDDANRLLGEDRSFAAGGTSSTLYDWDASGNLLQKAVDSDITTYQWDPLNRLVGVTDASSARTFGYDPDGIRVRETDPQGTTRLLHSFEDIIGTFDSANVQVAHYAHGPGVDEPLAQSTAGGSSYLHRDGINSVTALSGSTGQLVASRSYAPFGGLESSTGVASRYAYTSRESDSPDLMYYRARYYQPTVGRFLSADSFAPELTRTSTLHRYAYVGNNPTNFVDPSGHSALAAITVYISTFLVLLAAILDGLGIWQTTNINAGGAAGRQEIVKRIAGRFTNAAVILGVGLALAEAFGDSSLTFWQATAKFFVIVLINNIVAYGILQILGSISMLGVGATVGAIFLLFALYLLLYIMVVWVIDNASAGIISAIPDHI